MRFEFDLFEDVTHIEQISNPYFGRLVCKHESVEKSESVPRVTKAVLIGALRGKGAENNRGGSNCSLVAWILGLSRFHRRHSRAPSNRYRDAPRTFRQG